LYLGRVPHAPNYFLTWTCYGTWLHGDRRESVDKDHNTFGIPRLSPDEQLREHSRRALKFPEMRLCDTSRALVDAVIREHCRIREWRLHAINVRTNHVHVVVDCGETPPEPAMEQFKAWATRRLREAGLVEAGRVVWTEHGSTRYLFDDRGLHEAIRYVNEMQ